MKTRPIDPTAEKWDQDPLTKAEISRIKRKLAFWCVIIIIVTQLILFIL